MLRDLSLMQGPPLSLKFTLLRDPPLPLKPALLRDHPDPRLTLLRSPVSVQQHLVVQLIVGALLLVVHALPVKAKAVQGCGEERQQQARKASKSYQRYMGPTGGCGRG